MESISLWSLFWNLIYINTFTFGGGYTIVPVIKDRYVNKLNLLSEKDMLEIMALSQSVPGVYAISTSFLLGKKLKGFRGAIVATIASALPSMIIIGIIFVFYDNFIQNIYIKRALDGISAVVSAVLFVTVINMIKTINKNEKRLLLFMLMIISFVLSFVFKVHIALILIISSIIFLVCDRK